MLPVLEAVPNFSAGRDPALLKRLVEAAEAAGVDILDSSADADHNRSVVTLAGTPRQIEEASVAMAAEAIQSIDLRRHEGVHPRIGAIDVLPIVPLFGVDEGEARRVARRIGRRLARELSLPVYFYGAASDPPGRELAAIRRGGFEAIRHGFPDGREPDLVPGGAPVALPHPTAGAVCVGARPLLLAWNVDVSGLDIGQLREVAVGLRERNGGPPGVRALALVLEEQGRMQISMNLEDVRTRNPFGVFTLLEDEVEKRGGEVVSTEVIGMIPDALLLEAAADRLDLLDPAPSRVLSSRVLDHVAARTTAAAMQLVRSVEAGGSAVPVEVRQATVKLKEALVGDRVPLWSREDA
jgi:glutamate formiminotransferase